LNVRAPLRRHVLELSALAIEKLWRYADAPLLVTTYCPQADDLELAYGLMRTRLPDVISTHDLVQAFGLHGRHSAYELEALCELNLLRRFAPGFFHRSQEGTVIASAAEPAAYRLFVSRVVQLPVIRMVLSQLRESPDRSVPRSAIERTISVTSSRRYTRSTVGRRATTVISWMLWLENNVWFATPE
jgi:hypothetical protein